MGVQNILPLVVLSNETKNFKIYGELTELLTETLVPTTIPTSPTTPTTRSTYRVLPQEAGRTKNTEILQRVQQGNEIE